jgi:hypothetical protein
MKNTWLVVGGLVLCAIPAQAQLNQEWLEYRNETSTRLVAAPGLGVSDNQEKDYAWGDVNNDGWIDLVVVRKQPFTSPGKQPGVLLMNENGVLTDRTLQYASASDVPGDLGLMQPCNNRDVVLADFNNDGWLDFATAVTISDSDPKHISHPRIYMNRGAVGGVWQGFRFEAGRSPQLYPLLASGQPDTAHPYPGRFCSIAAGDVDNDGDMDIYLGDYDAGSFDGGELYDINDRLWINDGNGNFTDSYQTRMSATMLLSAFAASAAIADINGDGVKDVAKNTGLQTPQRVSVSYNKGPDPVPFDVFQVVSTASPYFVSVGDLNNDSKLDLVVSDDNADHYHLNQGNDGLGQVTWGTTNFSFASGGDDGFASQSLITDLDQDGFKDVMISDVDVDDATGYATGTACPGSTSGMRRLHIYRNLANPPAVTLKEEVQQAGTGGWKGLVGLTTNDLVGTYHTAAFDIDRDGDDDLVIGRTCSTSVWMNISRSRYGIAANNSAGHPARIWATGLMAVNSANLVLHASGAPPNSQGAFIVGTAKQDPCSPYDDGGLCIVSTGRFVTVGRATANAQGEATLNVSTATGPLAGLAPGSVRLVQFRYADPTGGPTGFNFSDGLELRFRP